LAICRDNGLEVILISALEMSFRTLMALHDEVSAGTLLDADVHPMTSVILAVISGELSDDLPVDEVFAAAREHGRSMSLAQVVELVLGALREHAVVPSGRV
jgi:hypothetical protein